MATSWATYSARRRERDLAEDPDAARAKAAAAKRAYRAKKKAGEQPPPLSPEEERAAAEEERAATLERYYRALDERDETLAAITELLTEDPGASFDSADYPWFYTISLQTVLALRRGETPRPLLPGVERLLREQLWAAVAPTPKPIARGGFDLERMAAKRAEREAYHARQAQGGEA